MPKKSTYWRTDILFGSEIETEWFRGVFEKGWFFFFHYDSTGDGKKIDPRSKRLHPY